MITADVARVTGGRLTGPKDNRITGLTIDSRSVTSDTGSLFFALRGTIHDGHDFIGSLIAKGIRSFVVDHIPHVDYDKSECAFITVPDTLKALHKIAGSRRDEFRGDVIAVTGSSGKTIVKEWLASVIGLEKRVVRSPRSLNSMTGVPLSVWKADNIFDTAIFEAGVSRQGDMKVIQKIIRPRFCVITNIGEAHQEKFADLREKIREKLALASEADYIIYPAACSELDEEVKILARGRKVSTASWIIAGDRDNDEHPSLHLSTDALYRASVRRTGSMASEIRIEFYDKSIEYTIPFADQASVENSVTVAVTSLLAGISHQSIIEAMSRLQPVAMRMAVRSGINNCVLIEDLYNSDIASLSISIDFLKNHQGRIHTLILSDIVETGRSHREMASEAARLIKSGKVSRFIGIGQGMAGNRDCFGSEALLYHSTAEFIAAFPRLKFADETILVKGPMASGFGKIVEMLELKKHTTVLEVNLDAILHNVNRVRSMLGRGVKLMGMVKAFAYGSGISEIGALLEDNGVDYLGVANADEGAELRESGINRPVLVMIPEESSFDTIIRYNLEPELYSFRILEGFIMAAERYGLSDWPVHIKLDTGMHRLGFQPEDAERLTQLLRNIGTVRVASVFTHLAATESEADDDRTRRQAAVFESVYEYLSAGLGYRPLRHILNSSGILRFPGFQYDMVRLGIGLYGLASVDDLKMKHTSRFLSRISQAKVVKAGEPVGYGYTDAADNDRVIATIPVGYADGLSRQMGNGRGSVWIRGRRVPIVGIVCMDMFMADITGTGATEGDSVEIFGDNIPVREVARVCNTIPYEIITSIPPRVKRVFYHET